MGKVSNGQPAHIGCSTSKDALAAYEQGLKPKSKWTMQDMADAFADYRFMECVKPIVNVELFDKADWLMFLYSTDWHHVGARVVEFFSVDGDAIATVTWRELNQRRHDDHDAPYVTVRLKADGRRLDGGLYGRCNAPTFVSDTGERFGHKEYELVGHAHTAVESPESSLRRLQRTALRGGCA